MYLQHYRLKELPFTLTPDTGFFMNRAGYQDALNVMLVALRSGEGFIKVVGEVGIGKTILCRKLLRIIGNDFVTAYIHNPFLKPETLLFAIADELRVEYKESVSQHILLKKLTGKLLDYHRQGKRVVLCMDEVQAMPIETLETVRLLTNLETEKRKLLQVVLFGQPELDNLLEQPSIRQLKQRITFSYRLLPMNRLATLGYIRHRLAVAGYKGRDIFSKQTIDYLYHVTGGIPRLINILCHKAMIVAYGEGDTKIKLRHMRKAAADTVETQRIQRSVFDFWLPSYTRWAFGVLGMISLIAAFKFAHIPELFT